MWTVHGRQNSGLRASRPTGLATGAKLAVQDGAGRVVPNGPGFLSASSRHAPFGITLSSAVYGGANVHQCRTTFGSAPAPSHTGAAV